MFDRATLGFLLSCVVAAVWLVHGLYNKLLHGSPRRRRAEADVRATDHAVYSHLRT
jgi:hypothetical protein